MPTYRKAIFTSVEQLDEAARALGWKAESQQLSRGDFFASVLSVESHHGCIVSTQFRAVIDHRVETPDEFIAFHLGRFDTGEITVCGYKLKDGDVVVLSPGSEVEYHLAGQVHNETLYLSKTAFDTACSRIAPRSELLSDGPSSIAHCDPRRFVSIRKKLREYAMNGILPQEDASRLLAAMILMVEEAPSRSLCKDLANDYVVGIARRARSYIENHIDETIRLEDLCSDVGVGLRTLQRCFSRHFQTSPVAYIQARRLNLARRELVSADPTGSTVTRIALDSGFNHLGRFSVDYHAHFGETPRQTLMSRVA